MLERTITVRGGAFTCTTCNKDIPAGEIAHVQFHMEHVPDPPADIDFALMPNHEPPTFRIILRMPEPSRFKRHKGMHPVIDRKECGPCNDKVRLNTLRLNCFV